MQKDIKLNVEGTTIEGMLSIPEKSEGLVLFAHGSGSSRFSPRNNAVARYLEGEKFATLLIDLLSEEEDMDYETRFDIGLLSKRLTAVSKWLLEYKDTKNLKIGLFGASTGAAAALITAASPAPAIRAVVSRGGRPDLAGNVLPKVKVPTLLIVGGNDFYVLELNKEAFSMLGAHEKKLEIIKGATHLFEEPGALEEVSRLTAQWFRRNL